MKTTREQLLDAIRDNPSEDTPRLMYADLLDELGGGENENRASIIRESLSGENPSAKGNVPEYILRWYADRISCDFERGFVTKVTCPADSWFAHATEILSNEPVVEVVLTTTPVIQFGPVERHEGYDDRRNLVFRCKWSVSVLRREEHDPGYHGVGPTVTFTPENTERFGFQQVLSRQQLAEKWAAGYARDMIERLIARHRTPLGYLNLKWKKIRFVILPDRERPGEYSETFSHGYVPE